VNTSTTDLEVSSPEPRRRRLGVRTIAVTAVAGTLAAAALLVAPVTGSQPTAQASAALNETVYNNWSIDGSNHDVYATVVGGPFLTVSPNTQVVRNISSFTIPSKWCAEVRYNGGPPQRKGPGTYTSFVDGVRLSIDPYLC
jgi:hypothetical protein